MLKRARVTIQQAKKIALARVKRGAIKCVELEKEKGVLIWSVDIAQPPKKDLTDVWVVATTGKITAVEVETPIIEREEVAEHKANSGYRWEIRSQYRQLDSHQHNQRAR